ncbi:MAG: GyrI-like domain-containing protein, partial [Singulisphaera sp.]
GVEVKDDARLPKGFVTVNVPSHQYAVFTHQGHVVGIRATIAAIWSKWFPASEYQAANAPTIERYGPEFNPATGLGGFEIWVPVQPRN